MLFETGTKKLDSLKMLDGAGLEKASSIKYLRQGWHEKLFLLKMLGGIGIKKLV